MTETPLRRHTLDNGLRLVVSEDHLAPVVAVNVWYDVGSRHEQPGRTGLAHLFEHLMFQGSRNVGPAEHFSLLQGVGATLNGTTSSTAPTTSRPCPPTPTSWRCGSRPTAWARCSTR